MDSQGVRKPSQGRRHHERLSRGFINLALPLTSNDKRRQQKIVKISWKVMVTNENRQRYKCTYSQYVWDVCNIIAWHGWEHDHQLRCGLASELRAKTRNWLQEDKESISENKLDYLALLLEDSQVIVQDWTLWQSYNSRLVVMRSLRRAQETLTR